jgi:hypothetical protein
MAKFNYGGRGKKMKNLVLKVVFFLSIESTELILEAILNFSKLKQETRVTNYDYAGYSLQ